MYMYYAYICTLLCLCTHVTNNFFFTTEHTCQTATSHTLSQDSEERDRKTDTHGAIVYTASVMTDKARGVVNGGGGGVSTIVVGAKGSQPTEVVDSWKRAAQINMKARELQVHVHVA